MKTYQVVLTVPGAQLSRSKAKRIEKSFSELYRRIVSPEAKAKVLWLTAPDGQIYQEREARPISVVAASVPDGYDQEPRERFIHAVLPMWTDVMDCTPHEVVISAADESTVTRVMEMSQERFRPDARRKTVARLLFRVISSKLLRGRMESAINF